jgi:hypothetical protein
VEVWLNSDIATKKYIDFDTGTYEHLQGHLDQEGLSLKKAEVGFDTIVNPTLAKYSKVNTDLNYFLNSWHSKKIILRDFWFRPNSYVGREHQKLKKYLVLGY